MRAARRQQLRAIYVGTASLRERRAFAEKVIASFPTCPILEVARLGRTLRAWRSQVLAYFDTDGLSNGGTEAINMHREGPAAGSRLPQLRQLPPAHAPRRQRHPHPPLSHEDELTTLKSEEPR